MGNIATLLNVKVRNEERHTITVTKSTSSFHEGENDGNVLEIYNSYNVDSSNNTDKFFNAKIFEGKSITEIIKKSHILSC